MEGKPMILFLPLGGSAFKRLDPLRWWIDQWDYYLGGSVETLDLEVWFIRGHDHY